MKIQNTTSGDIAFSDLRIPSLGLAQPIIEAGATVLVYNDQAEKSAQLAALILAGSIVKLSNEEPSDSLLTAENPMNYLFFNAGVPVNGTTGANAAFVGAICIDTTNANLYVNAGTKVSPTWKLVTRAD